MSVYVSHTCKKCGVAFMAEDLFNAKSKPPTWKYCNECVDAGFSNEKALKSEKSKRLKQYQNKHS
jgi:hypothetical protein